MRELFEAGAHYGYSRSRRHPSIKPFIFGTKDRVEIFDLEKTRDLLEEAKAFAAQLGREGKTLLFVGSKDEAHVPIRNAAERCGMPFVAGRWIGGTITNFAEIKKRLDRLEELRSMREKGELSKYTKRERLEFDREIAKLESMYGGALSMREGLPDALYVVDIAHEAIAVKEARRADIPVIGLASSDGDIESIEHPIVGNDSTLASITFFTNQIADAYNEGKQEAPRKQEGEATAGTTTAAQEEDNA